jgi:acid phosphatase (class A)
MLKLLITIVVIFSFSAQAKEKDWSKIPSNAFQMVPPPEFGTAEYDADFLQLHLYQNERTEAQCAEALDQKYIDLNAIYGGELPASDIKKTKKTIEKALKLGERTAAYFKGKFNRPRPYSTDSTLKPCIPKVAGSRSYPSAHATAGALSACVLGAIFPNKADELLQVGLYTGELRVISGVHHPSDVRAGQKLAADICEEIKSDKSFLKEIKDLK